MTSSATSRCRRKFLRFFPGGFRDPTYLAWERNYKWQAHTEWYSELGRREYAALLRRRDFATVARHAVRIEARTNLLFSFEKMALRDAVRSAAGARMFAEGLFELLHGRREPARRFETWCEVLGSLPRRQTRVVTWPIATIFGFLAQPARHLFIKPMVTKRAAERYGFEFHYESRPNWKTYVSALTFAKTIARDVENLRPRDMIDLQSFIWVQGSEEYEP